MDEYNAAAVRGLLNRMRSKEAGRAPLKLVVFDGDDTLWRTMPLYSAAKAEFGRRLFRTIGVCPGRAIEKLEQLDRDNFARLGVSRRRFPKSMSDAYSALEADLARTVDTILRKRVRRIAERVFVRRSLNIKGIRRVLRILKDEGIILVLCSKGDSRVQRFRIGQSELAHFFRKIYIVRDKSEAVFRQVLREQRVPPQDAFSVGNGIRSDINPALRIGMRAVWVKTTSMLRAIWRTCLGE